MTWARARDIRLLAASGAFRHFRFRVHRLLPVHPVAVSDQQRDRCTGGDSVSHTAEEFGAVAFDRHAPPAAVAALTTTELGVERVDVECETSGHAVEGDDQ